MKGGENLLLSLIDQRIIAKIRGLKGVYRAAVVATSPLTVQPRALTEDGKKQTAVRNVGQLDFGMFIKDGKARPLEVGDEVLVVVVSEGAPVFKKGGNYYADPYRANSIDSSIVLGVIK